MSPVLLLGAGTGEATCGILYLASYLRRHGVEAYVQLTETDQSPEELEHILLGAGFLAVDRRRVVVCGGGCGYVAVGARDHLR